MKNEEKKQETNITGKLIQPLLNGPFSKQSNKLMI